MEIEKLKKEIDELKSENKELKQRLEILEEVVAIIREDLYIDMEVELDEDKDGECGSCTGNCKSCKNEE